MYLIPNTNWLDSIRLFDYPEKRIPKSQKIDLESSAIVTIAGNKHLVALGSASTNDRKKILLVPLTDVTEQLTTASLLCRIVHQRLLIG